MFLPEKKEGSPGAKQYQPGIYTSTLTLNNTDLEVEVAVDASHINSIRFSNLDDTVTTMFPLIQPAIEDIAEQVYDTQSLENISLPQENPYTSQVILDTIEEALKKCHSQMTAAFIMFCSLSWSCTILSINKAVIFPYKQANMLPFYDKILSARQCKHFRSLLKLFI